MTDSVLDGRVMKCYRCLASKMEARSLQRPRRVAIRPNVKGLTTREFTVALEKWINGGASGSLTPPTWPARLRRLGLRPPLGGREGHNIGIQSGPSGSQTIHRPRNRDRSTWDGIGWRGTASSIVLATDPINSERIRLETPYGRAYVELPKFATRSAYWPL